MSVLEYLIELLNVKNQASLFNLFFKLCNVVGVGCAFFARCAEYKGVQLHCVTCLLAVQRSRCGLCIFFQMCGV